jgi:hypothetical protein
MRFWKYGCAKETFKEQGFLQEGAKPPLHKRASRLVDYMQATAIDELHILTNGFCWRNAQALAGDSYTKGFGTADPSKFAYGKLQGRLNMHAQHIIEATLMLIIVSQLITFEHRHSRSSIWGRGDTVPDN